MRRWADDVEARGPLTNIICCSRVHDVPYEECCLTIADDFAMLHKADVGSRFMKSVLKLTQVFNPPDLRRLAARFLQKHRIGTGFEQPAKPL